MAEPGSTPPTLLTLCSEAWTQWNHPWAGSMLRAFAQNGESSQRRQIDSALSFCCGWSCGRDALGCSADKHKAREVSGLCRSPGMGLSETQPGGPPRPFPSPGIRLFRPGQEFRPLWTSHMATMGPILGTLENTSYGERTDSCRTQGPSVPQFTSGHKWGQRTAFIPPSAFPRGRCPAGPFRSKALKSQNRIPARG